MWRLLFIAGLNTVELLRIETEPVSEISCNVVY